MNHGSLFSGIGGFDLAAQWIGWDNVFQVEWDKYCQKVLAKNFPNVSRYGDIKEFDGTKYRGAVDVLSGGFPCQPFSHAGKRKGESDDRYLWPEYLRIIREIKPSYVAGENVAGLTSMEDGKTLEGILTDLEGEGYAVESFIIPACSVGAWHRRERIWIIAYNNSRGRWKRKDGKIYQGGLSDSFRDCNSKDAGKVSTDTKSSGMERDRTIREQVTQAQAGPMLLRCDSARNGASYWSVEPGLGRVANGVPKRVDRLKGLGNAIVPQVAFEIFKAIEKLHHENKLE